VNLRVDGTRDMDTFYGAPPPERPGA